MVQLKEIAVLATIATIAHCQHSIANPNGRGVYARHAGEDAAAAPQANPWEQKYMAEIQKYNKLDTSYEDATKKPKSGEISRIPPVRPGFEESKARQGKNGLSEQTAPGAGRGRLGRLGGRLGGKAKLGGPTASPWLNKKLAWDNLAMKKDSSLLSQENAELRTDQADIKKYNSGLWPGHRKAAGAGPASNPRRLMRQDATVGMNRPAIGRRSAEPYYGSMSQRDLYARDAIPEAYAIPSYDDVAYDGLYARDASPEPYYEDAPLSKRDMNELLARDPEHLSERDIEFLAASLTERDLHDLMAREAGPEPEYDDYGLYARDAKAEAEAEVEFEDYGLYAREAEPEFEDHELWAREAEAEADAYAEAEADADADADADAEEAPLFPRDMAFMDAVRRMVGMNNKE